MGRSMNRDFSRLIESYKLLINGRLEEILPGENVRPVSLHRAMRYTALGGKRLRGILCMALHELFGDTHQKASLDAAASIELLHAYTLIHDDLPALDDDDMRRGKPSCHVKFGEAVAVLAGDALQALAFEVMSSLPAPPELSVEATNVLAHSAGSLMLVGGQVVDVESEGRKADEDLVTYIHSRKTGELIAASMSIGALLSGAKKEDYLNVHRIGRKVGLAFQIIDDILDLTGTEEQVGKRLRKDEEKGKVTYPSVFGLESSREKAVRLVDEAVDEISQFGDISFIQHVFDLIVNRIK